MTAFANQLRELADLIELDLPDNIPAPTVLVDTVSWHLTLAADPEPLARAVITAIGGEWHKPSSARAEYIEGNWRGLTAVIHLPAGRDWSHLTQGVGVAW